MVRAACMTHVSVDMRQRDAPNWVAEHLGASSRRPRHPFPALMAGETPGRVPVYLALKKPPHHAGNRTPGVKLQPSHDMATQAPSQHIENAESGRLPTQSSGHDGRVASMVLHVKVTVKDIAAEIQLEQWTSTSCCTSHSRQELPDTCSYPCHAQTGTTNRWCDPLPKWVKNRGGGTPLGNTSPLTLSTLMNKSPYRYNSHFALRHMPAT